MKMHDEVGRSMSEMETFQMETDSAPSVAVSYIFVVLRDSQRHVTERTGSCDACNPTLGGLRISEELAALRWLRGRGA